MKKYLFRKTLLGIAFGLILGIILLNVDRKLWWPLELETINNRNTSIVNLQKKTNKQDIVVVLFDDKTQFLLRQNGVPIKDFEKKGRNLLTQAVEKLTSYKVKSIGINLNLSTQNNQLDDLRLAQAISMAKNVVIADSVYSLTSGQPNLILMSTYLAGFGELYVDYDKVIHKARLVDEQYKNIPSFAYALFHASSTIPIDKNLKLKNEFYLQYPKQSFTTLSFIDLIENKLSPGLFRNKIVIIGNGQKSKLMRDGLLSPLNKTIYISDSEVQATVVQNLLHSKYLFKYGLIDFRISFLVLSMFIAALFSVLSAFKRLILTSLMIIGLIVLSQDCYSSNHILLEIVPVIFMLLANLIIGSLVSMHINLQEQNIELEEALKDLNKRSLELECSKEQLQEINIELNKALAELNNKIEELKDARKQLSSRSEEERKRIARELHDDSLARITDLRRYIESIIISSKMSVENKKDLGVCIQILDNVTQEVRRIINALRPSMLDNVLGLIPAIENLLDELHKRSHFKIQTKLITNITKIKLSDSQEINLYRIIQEALNNVFKHSNASNVKITIQEQPGQVLVLISDDGIGFDANIKPVRKSYGIIDMQERAELIGASIQYLNLPMAGGSTLAITIPIEKIELIVSEQTTKELAPGVLSE